VVEVVTKGRTMKSLIAVAIMLVFATGGSASGAQGFSAAEIRALVGGNEMTGTNSNGIGYSIEFDANGKWAGQCTGSAVNLGSKYCTADSGTWEATKDNELCLIYHSWQNGRTLCGPLSARGDTYSWVVGGARVAVKFAHPMKAIASPAPTSSPSP
jgi:hypothetical protein